MDENPPAPRPGDIIRLRRPVIAFYPEGHPRRTTHHGPLLKPPKEFVYVGPDPRPGVHVAGTPESSDGEFWEVFFRLDDLDTG